MSGKYFKFGCLFLLCSVWGDSLLLVAAVSHSPGKATQLKREIRESHGDHSFENSIKNIFNSKKSSIVRVVCVAKVEEGTKADVNNAKQVLGGTGFFVSDKAHILTAASIVKNSQMIWIDYGGVSYSAECIGVDLQTNVAVLRLLQPPNEFGIVDISENNAVALTEIGSFIVFVGCKLGMDPLPELGNVTGKNISYGDNTFVTTYLRTNLMFCGGESGAPVFELDGKLSGMMIASLPEMASSFILPRRALSKVVDAIISNGVMKHPKLGIEIQSECRFNRGQEIVISKVIAGSEAEKAGLAVGDIIKKIGNFDINYREDLYNAVFFECQNGQITITTLREGKELSFQVNNEYMIE
ncbi:MAG: S1C family serine protease [Puniceicoccales bacterium]|jgi:S1-C subfamily serine protease|nr:S1C family serine protease [Puniceicoccales bacterium]